MTRPITKDEFLAGVKFRYRDNPAVYQFEPPAAKGSVLAGFIYHIPRRRDYAECIVEDISVERILCVAIVLGKVLPSFSIPLYELTVVEEKPEDTDRIIPDENGGL